MSHVAVGYLPDRSIFPSFSLPSFYSLTPADSLSLTPRPHSDFPSFLQKSPLFSRPENTSIIHFTPPHFRFLPSSWRLQELRKGGYDMEAEFLAMFDEASKAADAAALDVKSSGDDDKCRCLHALKALQAFPVTSHLLISTQVGKNLRRLTKHPRKEIQAFASDLLQEWKQIFMEEINGCKNNGNGKNSDERKVSVKTEALTGSEVLKTSSLRVQVSRSDSFKARKIGQNGSPRSAKSTDSDSPLTHANKNGTEIPRAAAVGPSGFAMKCNDPLRDRAREHLFEALSKVSAEVDDDMIDEVKKCDPAHVAVLVESAMYEKWGKMNGAHKVKYRSIMFNIKDAKNPDFRRKVLLGQVKPEALLSMTSEEMASEQRKQQNQKVKEKALFDCELGGAPKATTDQFKCGRCGQRQCTYYQMQTRSADEPMTTYVTCVNCNNHWKFC
ncbi:hypothetical protein MLD38_018836 [Melastoma candidum]|uniref:Uncharacterized protein n=1 Tax=Melastoma candidum TaxID=119954 RepID=A0ACB9QV03_9MYRT|nr:hypothetical protein MLD38_018836 [Melastoma candidum]